MKRAVVLGGRVTFKRAAYIDRRAQKLLYPEDDEDDEDEQKLGETAVKKGRK